MRLLAALFGLILAGIVQAQSVYRCVVEGVTVFSSTPCDQEQIDRHASQQAERRAVQPQTRQQGSQTTPPPSRPVPDDPIAVVVQGSQDRGIVSGYRLGDAGPVILVRPIFHEMDMGDKRAIAASFLAHAQRQRPDANYDILLILDSRNNNVVGNYDPRLGLSLRRDYRR